MSEIIDLGNGYGRLTPYRSKYASITFPLELKDVKMLYGDGYIDKDEAITVLLWMGYSPDEISLLLVWVHRIRTRRESELANGRTT